MMRRPENDISNKAVLAVLILVILVSLFSMSIYFNAIRAAQPTYTAQGKILLSIVEPPKAPVAAIPVEESGKVKLEISAPSTESVKKVAEIKE